MPRVTGYLYKFFVGLGLTWIHKKFFFLLEIGKGKFIQMGLIFKHIENLSILFQILACKDLYNKTKILKQCLNS